MLFRFLVICLFIIKFETFCLGKFSFGKCVYMRYLWCIWYFPKIKLSPAKWKRIVGKVQLPVRNFISLKVFIPFCFRISRYESNCLGIKDWLFSRLIRKLYIPTQLRIIFWGDWQTTAKRRGRPNKGMLFLCEDRGRNSSRHHEVFELTLVDDYISFAFTLQPVPPAICHFSRKTCKIP